MNYPEFRNPPIRKIGFTLIELLTVIAVIGILSSILVVGLQRARGAAETAKCVAHWRQWGSALELYVGDNNGYLPETNFVGEEVWIQLSPYFSFEGVENLAGKRLEEAQRYIRRDASCSVEDWGFGFNVYLTDSKDDEDGNKVAVAKPAVTIEDPAKRIFGMDMGWPKRWLDGTVIVGGGSSDKLATATPKPHNGKVNVLYLDGHVETKFASEIMKSEMNGRFEDRDEPIADPDYDV